MQSRLFFSTLGEPFLHKTLITTRLRSSTPSKLQYFFNYCRVKQCLRTSTNFSGRVKSSSEASDTSSRSIYYKQTTRPKRIIPRSKASETSSSSIRSGRPASASVLTPSNALATYLDTQDEASKRAYFKALRFQLPLDAFQVMVMRYLHQWGPDLWRKDELLKALEPYVEQRGISMLELSIWARIVAEYDADKRVQKFLATATRYPSFLLLEVCRRDIQQVKTLEAILDHVWDKILLKPNLTSDSNFRRQKSLETSSRPLPLEDIFHENAFLILLTRLLYHCRRIWPAAIVTVARMFGPYIDTLNINNPEGYRTLDPATYRRVCSFQNVLLRDLALPTTLQTYQSTAYSWSAQKIILELSGTFSPPLMLDEAAYQAVIQVLVASKKTPSETRSATLRSRNWPPWRIDQDGMDAQRELEEDLSRGVAALMRKRESGYGDDSYDQIMSILGGQEPDGTPTIQTRAFVKNRNLQPNRQVLGHLDPKLWAARVVATRDVQEAWAAYTEFFKQGGTPNLSMYYAMFQKLVYDEKRLNTGRVGAHVTPGDGREVLPIPDSNISDFYRSRIKPPSRRELYEEMIQHGVRPSGQCLSFLIQRAPSINMGLRYLHDSGLGNGQLRNLHGVDIRYKSVNELKQIRHEFATTMPLPTVTDFVILLCRFAPRAVRASTMDTLEGRNSNNPEPDKEWVIRQVYSRRLNPLFNKPLNHAAYLLKASGTKHRMAWYSFWAALAKDSNIFYSAGDPRNWQTSWRAAYASLLEFQRLGLELEPDGLRRICDTFTNYAKAFLKHPDFHDDVLEGSELIKTEFEKLTIVNETLDHDLPRLLHHFHGAHLHAFTRSMGTVENYHEIISMLEWMVLNQTELGAVADQTANGRNLLRRTLTATRVFCEGTPYESRARSLMDEFEDLGGWPTHDEVLVYLSNAEDSSQPGEEELREEEWSEDEY